LDQLAAAAFLDTLLAPFLDLVEAPGRRPQRRALRSGRDRCRSGGSGRRLDPLPLQCGRRLSRRRRRRHALLAGRLRQAPDAFLLDVGGWRGGRPGRGKWGLRRGGLRRLLELLRGPLGRGRRLELPRGLLGRRRLLELLHRPLWRGQLPLRRRRCDCPGRWGWLRPGRSGPLSLLLLLPLVCGLRMSRPDQSEAIGRGAGHGCGKRSPEDYQNAGLLAFLHLPLRDNPRSVRHTPVRDEYARTASIAVCAICGGSEAGK
jgi:hypothetical protein